MRVRGRKKVGALIVEVDEESPLREIVEPGDRLISINRRSPRDLIDLYWLQDEEELLVKVAGKKGKRVIRLSKEAGRPLGLTFHQAIFEAPRTCGNSCLFCFIDQLPTGLRESLYLKDDDYRLSVLQGNFITLNNLAERDLRRILTQNLQPLYISLHTTDWRLRDHLMGTDASKKALSSLKRLIDHGLEVHLQVVLCPGLNDGPRLEETLGSCLERYPARSLAVVPVSLLGEHGRDRGLRSLTPEDAAKAIDAVERSQQSFLTVWGRRFCYASDEMFYLAGVPLPPARYYDDWPQLENGVGMARSFIDEAQAALRDHPLGNAQKDLALITGRLGLRVLTEALTGGGVEFPVRIICLENRVFGPEVTVSGLLGGKEIGEALEDCQGCRLALVPGNALSEGRFIDGMSLEELSARSSVRIKPVEPEGGLLAEELRCAGEGRDG